MDRARTIRPCSHALRPRASGERGFTLVEVIVVLVIVVIIGAVASIALQRTRANEAAPLVNAAAGVIWRGVQDYRYEHNGAFPPASALTSSGTTFVSESGARYVQRWPENHKGEPMPVVGRPPSAATSETTIPVPPSSVSPTSSEAGSIVYWASSDSPPISGWLAGYAPNGNLVFLRTALPQTVRSVG